LLGPRYQASSLLLTRPSLGLASVLCSSWVHHLEFSLGIKAQVPTFRTKATLWSHAVCMPVATRTIGRHPPSFIPGQQQEPGFDDIPTLSTLHQRFTHVRLTSAYLTGYSRLFRNAHHPSHCAGAAYGGLNPDPAIRVRGADPHLLCSKAALSWLYILTSSSRRRGALSSAYLTTIISPVAWRLRHC
jgi:hypothetical protein